MKNTLRKKVALYDPYLDIMGGGERYVLSVLKVLADQGYDITVYWDNNLSSEISHKLQLDIKSIEFKPHHNLKSFISRTKELAQYDMYIYVTDGSYHYSSAKKNIIYCMVPDKKLYTKTLLNTLKTHNALFITHSHFVSTLLHSWGITNRVLYPFIANEFLKNHPVKKNKTILMVGRFFTHLHAKRQDVGIEWFHKLKKVHPEFSDYKLILAGMMKPEDEAYVRLLQNQAKNDPSIEFKPNIAFSNLLALYQSSLFYWHFSGYGVNEHTHPEQVEHLGIAPLEAMAAGCITCAYAAGGPKEILSSGTTGILFTHQDELFTQMTALLASQSDITDMTQRAKQYVAERFSYEAFSKRVISILKP